MGNPVGRRAQPPDQRGRRTLTRRFADTSVILGYLDGDAKCVDAYEGGEWITSHAHLLEVYSVLLGRPEVPADQPDEILERLLPLTLPIPHASVKPAAEIRRKLRAQGKDCSYIDALGYGVAQALGVELLITDEAFEGVHGAVRIPLRQQAGGGKRKRSS